MLHYSPPFCCDSGQWGWQHMNFFSNPAVWPQPESVLMARADVSAFRSQLFPLFQKHMPAQSISGNLLLHSRSRV